MSIFCTPERLQSFSWKSEPVYCLSVLPPGGTNGQNLLADPRSAELIPAFPFVSEMNFDIQLLINNPARNQVLRRQ